MASTDDEESPRLPGQRKESLKSLPHHDSLRELELKEARAEVRKSKKLVSGGSGSGSNTNLNNNNTTTTTNNSTSNTNLAGSGVIHDHHMGEPAPSSPSLSESSNSNLLHADGGDPGPKKDGGAKRGAIVSAKDIEISPQDQLHLQDTLDPEIHRGKPKKKSKLSNIRKKPVVEDKAPRRIYFNEPNQNASFKYAANSISTTKYTPITFLPKNLLEQFRRAANFYFLVIAMIQLIPGLSSVSAYSSIVPLVIVLSVTMVKEGYEDWKRYLSDRETNNYLCNVLRGNEFKKVEWSKVVVGDILKVYNGERLPADMVLLNSSETQGLCYVETANLDGETNLKLYQAIPETTALNTEPELSAFKAFVECERPNNRLYTFNGFMDIGSATKSLAAKQVLLRGCLLKNTQWITGLVIYTGFETKLMQNATSPPSKRTSLERKTNTSLIYIFSFMCLICAIGAIGSGIWTAVVQDDTWYVPRQYNPGVQGIINFFSFMIEFSVMIPISLYVSMEMVKVAQALFIGQDLLMYYEENDTPARARTSNLSEELGQVEYIFSDKTGTLTRNIMEFFKCSIGGVSYGTGLTEIAITKAKREEREILIPDTTQLPDVTPNFSFNDRRLLEDLKKEGQREKIIEFFSLLSICHTVIPERQEEGKIKYQAASPDEATLVDAARNLGFFFHTRNPKDIICNILGEDVQFVILNVLEFNSTRKRMSVITKDTSSGKIRLHCKGADTVIFQRLSDGQQELRTQTVEHLEDYASDGLRTLCLAYREIPEDEYEAWNEQFHEANIAIDNRDEKLMAVAELIEKDLSLIGATAIEDKLQEGVPDAIYTLAQAEIKIWVLTGDHQETAINIGFACSLLTSSMTIMIVNAQDAQETERQLLAAISQSEDPDGEYGLVIDGFTLQFALEPGRNLRLLQLAKRCAAVICCRVSPLQKAQVVTLVKESLRVITLAIGDGANDVSMIQQAHIGIGISGQEGMQAVMNSDYAIAQFRFLTRLLLIHGRSDYKRVYAYILYSFYKNMVFSLSQFPLDWYNGFSAQVMYDGWSTTIFNIIFTGLPIILYAIFDQDVTPKMVYQYPQMYETGQKNLEYNTKLLLYWLGTGVYQAFVVFFTAFLIWGGGNIFTNGQTAGLWSLGAFCYFAVIFTVNMRLALETRYWTGFTYFAIIGCTLIWFVWMCIEGGVPVFITDGIMYHVAFHLWTSGMFWLGVLFICALSIMPVVAIEYLRRQLRPQNYQIVQELKRIARLERERKAIEMNGGRVGIFKSRKAIRKSMRHADRDEKERADAKPDALDLESKFTGYAFSPDDNAGQALSTEFKNQNTSNKNLGNNPKKAPSRQASSSASSSSKPTKQSSKTTLPFPQ